MPNRTRMNGEGCVYYREKEGRYMAQTYFPTPDGRKVRKCFYGKTREEALKKMTRALCKVRSSFYD